MIREYIKRIAIVMCGMVVSAVGIAMTLQANIGLEPWSVLQQGMAQTLGISYGTAASIVGAAVILIAVLCGESIGIGSIINIVCGPIVDAVLLLNFIPKMDSIGGGILMLLGGMELLVLGTWLYMTTALGSGPRDALMVALARKTKRSVGLCRSTVEILAIIAGWLMGGQVGIGTVITGVGLGPLINLNFSLLHFKAAELHQENLPETLRKLKGTKTT